MGDITILSEKQKQKAIEELRYYKKVYVCRRCRTVYGSDLVTDSGRCSKCSKELKGGN